MNRHGIPPGLAGFRLSMVNCHLLWEGNEAVLIDTGLAGEDRLIWRMLDRIGLRPESLKAILLTHGHLDHVGNLDRIARKSGALVYLHPADLPFLSGSFPYQGATRVCGWLEKTGRRLFRYRAGPVHAFLHHGQRLPYWGGLQVVHLPGHTPGHCGFLSERFNLLFTGDLFVTQFGRSSLPPPFLNVSPEWFPESFRRVAALAPTGIVPNHYDLLRPLRAATLFRSLYQRKQARWESPAPVVL